MIEVFLILYLAMPGEQPKSFREKMISVQECVYHATNLMLHPPDVAMHKGGTLQVACELRLPKSESH